MMKLVELFLRLIFIELFSISHSQLSSVVLLEVASTSLSFIF